MQRLNGFWVIAALAFAAQALPVSDNTAEAGRRHWRRCGCGSTGYGGYGGYQVYQQQAAPCQTNACQPQYTQQMAPIPDPTWQNQGAPGVQYGTGYRGTQSGVDASGHRYDPALQHPNRINNSTNLNNPPPPPAEAPVQREATSTQPAVDEAVRSNATESSERLEEAPAP